MKYGYARVSTKDQNLDRQLDSLTQYVDKKNIYYDKKSGKNFNRPEYEKLKAKLRSGDEVYIHALDRLSRNKGESKGEIEWFRKNGIILRVLNIPTTLIDIPGQEWVLEMVSNVLYEVLTSLAEQERQELVTRTKEGLEAARKRGAKLGRPTQFNGVIDKPEDESISAYCKRVGIGKGTYYKYC